MNYREAIKNMTQKVPMSVRNGDQIRTIGYKKALENALTVIGKSRATEVDLIRAYEALKAYE
jgi:uncharacterized transporter YbjL